MHRRPVQSDPEWSHARLLLIEDDADQRRLLTLLLKRERFDVTACSTTEEALQVLPHGKFAVAVVDLSLPGKGGIDFVKEVAARKEKTRVIIHTGYGSFESAKEGLNLGVFAYVEKIGNFDSLLEHVRSAATDYLHESLSLAEDEILFQLRLLDAVEEGVVATNLDAEIIYWNRAAERLTGWLHEDVFGKNFYETVAAEDSLQLQTAMQERLQSGLAWIGELRLKKVSDHSDESATVATETTSRSPQESLAAIPVRFSLSPVWNSDDSPAGYIGTFADITIEKAAELELKAHARRQAVGAQLGLYAASETDPDKFMVRLAQSVCEALESDSLEILQWQSADSSFVLRTGHGDSFDRIGTASVSGGERSIAGYVYRTKETIALECEASDNRFDMESWASDAGLQAAVVTPISVSVHGFGVMAVRCRRRRVFSAAEIDFIKMVGNLLAGTIERRELLSRWQSLFQNTLDAVVLTDDRNCCVEVNAAACKMLGYRHDELIGMKMANLIAEEGPEGGVNPWRNDGGRNRTTGQVWLKSSSGGLVCTEYRVVSHVIPGMHLCDFRDITEQKRTAELCQINVSLTHVHAWRLWDRWLPCCRMRLINRWGRLG
ncbi:MAG: PAS domain S-box protein [Pirellulales bacterium]